MKTMGERRKVPQVRRAVLGAAVLVAVGAGTIALSTSAFGAPTPTPTSAAAAAPTDAAPPTEVHLPNLPKSMSPPNINPNKTYIPPDPAARQAPQPSFAQNMTDPAVKHDVPGELRSAKAQTANAPSTIICLTPGDTAVFVIYLDRVHPEIPLTDQDRKAGCERAVKGAHHVAP